MKVEIETQIEVTMKMNLREARIILKALAYTSEAVAPGSDALLTDIITALNAQEERK